MTLAARPLDNSRTDGPDLTADDHEPARIDLPEFGRSDGLAPNKVPWQAVPGKDVTPPTVRRAVAFRSTTGSKPPANTRE